MCAVTWATPQWENQGLRLKVIYFFFNLLSLWDQVIWGRNVRRRKLSEFLAATLGENRDVFLRGTLHGFGCSQLGFLRQKLVFLKEDVLPRAGLLPVLALVLVPNSGVCRRA